MLNQYDRPAENPGRKKMDGYFVKPSILTGLNTTKPNIKKLGKIVATVGAILMALYAAKYITERLSPEKAYEQLKMKQEIQRQMEINPYEPPSNNVGGLERSLGI